MNSCKKRMHSFIIVTVLAMTVFWSAQAGAHYPWIDITNYAPTTNEAPLMRIGWGHKFPVDGFLRAEDLEEISMISSTGARIKIMPLSETEFTGETGLADGAYLVAAKRESSFYTKTSEGGKRQSKKGLDNVVKCYWSTMSMKSVVNVGAGGGMVDQVVGHPLEIIPLTNPDLIKVGDTLPILVLLKGKPYGGEISATYSGFSVGKNAFATTITTDQTGQGSIEINASGIWLLKTQHELPYHQPEECDVESYVATITFEIR